MRLQDLTPSVPELSFSAGDPLSALDNIMSVCRAVTSHIMKSIEKLKARLTRKAAAVIGIDLDPVGCEKRRMTAKLLPVMVNAYKLMKMFSHVKTSDV